MPSCLDVLVVEFKYGSQYLCPSGLLLTSTDESIRCRPIYFSQNRKALFSHIHLRVCMRTQCACVKYKDEKVAYIERQKITLSRKILLEKLQFQVVSSVRWLVFRRYR